MRIPLLRVPLLAVAAAMPVWAHAVPVQLARQGQPLLPVVVAPDASPQIRQAASDLASYLARIVGGPVEVTTGDGRRGIVVGLARQFPAVAAAGKAPGEGVAEREDYLIETGKDRALLLGATEQAVEHAVWDLLHRAGYRQFFPGERWEVVPRAPDLALDVQVKESPSYRSRRIWYGYGPWDYAKEPYRQWTVRNRATAGFQLNTGHAYGGIIRALKKEFDQHPEFYALVNGERKVWRNAKLCIGNEDLRRLIVQYELEQFRKNPALDSVSLDPSDGGGWCECEKCRALGSISDRVVLLANEVAAAVQVQYPGKAVGIYAYAFHSPPPTIAVHPNVVVSVATAFIKGDFSVAELMAGWQQKGAVLGMREYYSVNPWDRDQPGHARGGNLAYLASSIPGFHRDGARFMSAESSDNWGPNGLGYYVASRLLWNVAEAGQVDALVEDFLARAFGPAREPMRDFYAQLDGSRSRLGPDDQVGRMFRALADARRLAAGDAAVMARLNDLVLYAHYCSLYHRYAMAGDADRQAGFEALIRHAYRMRTTMMVHAKALYRDLGNRDKSVTVPADAKWTVPEGKNPWKSSRPFEADEIAAMVADGIARHPLATLALEVPVFSERLLPGRPLAAANADPGGFGVGQGDQTFLTYVDDVSRPIAVHLTGGLSRVDRGNVRVSLWKLGGASETGERETLVAEDRSVPPDGKEHVVALSPRDRGLHRLTVADGMGGTEVRLPAELPAVVPSSGGGGMNLHYRQWMAYFYVPAGTKSIGLYGGEHGEVQDSRNRTVFWLNGRKRGFHAVPVPAGEDGKVWRIRYGRSDVRLLTVPPYFAATPAQLLVPQEILEKDGARPR